MSSTTTSLQTFRHLLCSEDLESIPTGVNEDEYLMRFLRFQSDPKRAYETLKKYHEFRKNDKALFARMHPNALKHIFDSNIVTKLPGNDAEGRPVILFNFMFWDVKLYSAEDFVLLTMMFLEELIRTQVSSVTFVLDWEGYGLANFRQYTYRNIMRTFALAKGSFPISFKGIHQINENRVFWLVSKVVFALFSGKLKKRMHVHGTDRESLAAYIPFSSLPAEYGGTAEGYVDTAFMDEMYKNEQYYKAIAPKD